MFTMKVAALAFIGSAAAFNPMMQMSTGRRVAIQVPFFALGPGAHSRTGRKERPLRGVVVLRSTLLVQGRAQPR